MTDPVGNNLSEIVPKLMATMVRAMGQDLPPSIAAIPEFKQEWGAFYKDLAEGGLAGFSRNYSLKTVAIDVSATRQVGGMEMLARTAMAFAVWQVLEEPMKYLIAQSCDATGHTRILKMEGSEND